MLMLPGGRFGWEEAAMVMVSVSCGHQHFNFTHISNPADIFTKEMRAGVNFHQLQDSFMSRASDFLKGIFTSLHFPSRTLPEHVAQTANYVSPSRSGILDVLLSLPLSRTRGTISCLSSAGKYILSRTTKGLSSRLL